MSKRKTNLIENVLERNFQRNLVKDIKNRFKGSIVCRLDPNYIQGIPDLLILYEDKWAALECKKSRNAKHRPNQDYYVNLMDKMSFSKFIYPENKERILNEMEQTFRTRRPTRISRSK